MILISHRGNLTGPEPGRENSPSYIQEALSAGYNVEIDVWYRNQKWHLGHDEPRYEVEKDFFNPFMWCHAKNIDALKELSSLQAHCFWHQTDDVTLTSRGYLWTYPGLPLTPSSICVMPEYTSYSKEEITASAGICSDNIQYFKQ